jgi:hypothetical protein
MGAGRACAAAELRVHWRALLVLAVLTALASGTVTALVAGARRADSSLERLAAETRVGDVFVNAIGARPDELQQLASLPEVEAFAPFAFVPLLSDQLPDAGAFASIDGVWLDRVDRPLLLRGRRPAPTEADAVLVNEEFARQSGLDVGDTFPAATFSAEQLAAQRFDEPPGGPMVHLEVAGVVRLPLDLGANAGDATVYLTPAFLEAHPDVGAPRGPAMVRLRDGVADFPAFEQGARELLGERLLDIASFGGPERAIAAAVDVQRNALLVLAAGVALAALVVVAQAAVRHVTARRDEQLPLRAIGLARRSRIQAVTLAPAIAVGAGVLLGGAVAVGVSRFLPRGLPHLADPDPGAYADWTALVVVCAVFAVLVIAAMVAAAVRVTSVAREVVAVAGGGRPGAASTLAASGAPPSMVAGARLAARSGGARPAIAGLAVGITGTVAALVFGASLERLVTTPARYGLAVDAEGFLGSDELDASVAATAAADPGVDALSVASYAASVQLPRGKASPLYGISSFSGGWPATILEGRPPASPGEAIVGAGTLAAIDARVGDSIPVVAGDTRTMVRVVGRGLFPIVADGTYDSGVMVPVDTFDAIGVPSPDHYVFVTFAPGTDRSAAIARLDDLGVSVGSASPPSEIHNLLDVRGYPLVLAVLLGTVAFAAAVHALTSHADRRRHELGILRALGFVRRQVRGALLWQAAFLVGAGLLLGLPLGIAVGRQAWRFLAQGLSVSPSAVLPVAAVVAAVAIVVVVVGLVAWFTGRGAARGRLVLTPPE